MGLLSFTKRNLEATKYAQLQASAMIVVPAGMTILGDIVIEDLLAGMPEPRAFLVAGFVRGNITLRDCNNAAEAKATLIVRGGAIYDCDLLDFETVHLDDCVVHGKLTAKRIITHNSVNLNGVNTLSYGNKTNDLSQANWYHDCLRRANRG
jgi:hypothetical protein